MTSVNVSERMIDIAGPTQEVEISIKRDIVGISLWVNVDGVCRFRVKQIPIEILMVDYDYQPAIIRGAGNRNV